MSNYPAGAEFAQNAPWNKPDHVVSKQHLDEANEKIPDPLCDLNEPCTFMAFSQATDHINWGGVDSDFWWHYQDGDVVVPAKILTPEQQADLAAHIHDWVATTAESIADDDDGDNGYGDWAYEQQKDRMNNP